MKGTYPELVGLRLDRVFLFADQISFLIPHEWQEIEEEGDHYCYEEPEHQGWLRVSLLTKRGPGAGNRKRLELELKKEAQKKGARLFRAGSNIAELLTEFSEREGVPVVNTFWLVTHCFPPDCYKRAIFTYSIRSARLQEQETAQMIQFLTEVICAAKFKCTTKPLPAKPSQTFS